MMRRMAEQSRGTRYAALWTKEWTQDSRGTKEWTQDSGGTKEWTQDNGGTKDLKTNALDSIRYRLCI
jgi:hypothetical protein